MLSRIPLSIIFSADGRRHRIPHCTYCVSAFPAEDDDDVSKAESEESLAFFRYLDSNDTRVPAHPSLRAYAHPPEAYETYVGDEVWDEDERRPHCQRERSLPPQHSDKADALSASTSSSDAAAPVPAFHHVVEWVNRLFAEEAWAADGVVLCGRYVVADDGAWVVPSRSPTLFTTREVFLLMRSSCKFLNDVHVQMRAVDDVVRRGLCSSAVTLEFTIAKAMAGPGASEMRAIVPYPIQWSPSASSWVATASAGCLSFAGIGQRVTDVCFPSLMAWTEGEHDENFRIMLRRVEQAALLERACAADPDFVARLACPFEERKRPLPSSSSIVDATGVQFRDRLELVLLLAVDLIFESPSLPVYVLSAKARAFERVARNDPAWQAAVADAPEWPRWTPFLAGPAEERPTSEATNSNDDSESPAATAHSTDNQVGGATSEKSDGDDGGQDCTAVEGTEDGEDEMEGEEEVSRAHIFFRMFRDVAGWNQYVAAMMQRLSRGCQTAIGSSDSNKPSLAVQHYCVVASDGADLLPCADVLSKRGLPLELRHPELLTHNADAASYLKMLRDELLRRPAKE